MRGVPRVGDASRRLSRGVARSPATPALDRGRDGRRVMVSPCHRCPLHPAAASAVRVRRFGVIPAFVPPPPELRGPA
ncbi:hypothetical protein BV25DRAFT_1828004 [Artomyces pyxidatus]|uniref:Uncharacterized protein n=1 Tax=Artomyces pyxidatus TaxID=48021 RepID=A0ACB8SWH1_9AGAM|nr:hypothetical protein BV25DRAFT_1828004 [Artomyces pyxidatus]